MVAGKEEVKRTTKLLLLIMFPKYLFDWRSAVFLGGGLTALFNHDGCLQYEEMLGPLETAVNISDCHLYKNKVKTESLIYGYFEGTIHSTAPLTTPCPPGHEGQPVDVVIMQKYRTTAEVAKSRFAKTASLTERVWLVNPPRRRYMDSGLEVGGHITLCDKDSGLVVRVDPSFIPKMRLKQLMYCDDTSLAGAGDGDLRTQGRDGDGDVDTNRENLRNVFVIGGIPVGQRICVIGDFKFGAASSNDNPSVDVSIVSEPTLFQNDNRLFGSFYGTFQAVKQGKLEMYEGYKAKRVVGAVAAAGALALMLILP